MSYEGRHRVLVVEDSDALRGMLTEFLSRNGFWAVGASNGREALEIAKTSKLPWFAMISDFSMPEMNGDEFLLEALKYVQVEKVIVVSAMAEESTEISELLSDLNGRVRVVFISKPCTPSRIIAELVGQ